MSILLCLLLQLPARADGARFVFDERAAEHLLARATFGADGVRIRDAVEAGLDETVAGLFRTANSRDPYLVLRFEPPREELLPLDDEARRELYRQARIRDRQQVADFRIDWMERIQSGDDPLRERMLLFWHGVFTTSCQDVEQSDKVLRQIEFLRANSLSSYAELLRGIVRDPGMLDYLDNEENRKKSPNENLGRELLELFSLGEGNYTEQDVQHAARALTGRRSDDDGRYQFRLGDHDTAEKTIFGVTGRHTGDDLVDLILAREACARFVAGRMIEYFEGLAPQPDRLDRYAALLRENEYRVRPLLEQLFTDPAFYREEIRGGRVTSPVDYLIGTSNRLGVDLPAPFLVLACSALGQRFMEPPNVEGWEEGPGWITTSSILLRGNLAGMILGVVGGEEIADEPQAAGAMTMSGPDRNVPAFTRELRALRLFGETRYRPRINLTARLAVRDPRGDEQVVAYLIEELLAAEVETGTRASLVEFLTSEREALEIAEESLLDGTWESEQLLRRLAHVILSLPEAQLS